MIEENDTKQKALTILDNLINKYELDIQYTYVDEKLIDGYGEPNHFEFADTKWLRSYRDICKHHLITLRDVRMEMCQKL